MKLRSLHIEDYKVFKNFDIDFVNENDKPLPIVVLAGVNGSGKTTLLEYIYNCILENKNFIKIEIRRKTEAIDEFYNEDTREYILENKKLSKSNLNYLDNYKQTILYFPIAKSNMLDVKESILSLYRKKARETSHIEALQYFQEYIGDIFKELKIDLTIDDINDVDRKNEMVIFKNLSGKTFEIKELSTGEKTLFSKALYLHLKEYKDKVILIDEPELSLHPSWQNKILNIYKKFAEDNNCQIIIATHSPHIITSADNESIRFLEKNEEGNISVINDIQTYGRDIEWVLQQMGVKNLRVSEVLEKFIHCQELLNNEKYNEAEIYINNLEEEIGQDDKQIMNLRNALFFERD